MRDVFVAIYPLFVSMQKIRQRMLVMHIARSHHRVVGQAALAVHTDVQLHHEVPGIALLGLVHFGITLLLGILCGTRSADDRGIYDGACLEFEATGLQYLPNLDE